MSHTHYLERIFRRVLHSVLIGRTTTSSDQTKATGTVQAQINGLMVKDAVRVVQQFGLASAFPVGTDVVIVCVHGDPSNAMIVGANNQQFRPVHLADGETKLYDANSQFIYLSKTGIVIEGNTNPVTVHTTMTVTINATNGVVVNAPGQTITLNAANVHVTGNLQVDGNEQVNGNVGVGGNENVIGTVHASNIT